MGGLQIHCPVCCCKSFDSKQSLLEHLLDVVDKLYCPLCNSKYSSLEGIIEHLNQADCYIVQDKTIENIVIYKQNNDNTENSTDFKNIERLSDELNSEFITDQPLECQDDTGDITKMYELMLKPHELKLIKEDGENRYVIVNPDEGMSAIVTKQNIDGTVSLTSRDVKEETLLVTESDLKNNQEEIYTCNACKVSFTSVYEHIQIYHNDQDVVLEDITPEIEAENNQIPVNSDDQEGEESSSIDKLTARRVITETGNIVEEPMSLKSENTEIQHVIDEIDKHSELVSAKQVRTEKKKMVQINHTEVSIVKNDNKYGNRKVDPYHKVIRKEVQSNTGDTTTMYHCLVCNINVSNISEFGGHPCKIHKFPCPCCPAAYDTSKSLRLHMKVHKIIPDASTDAPVTYECEVCSTVFFTNKSLKLHKRMHDPVKARPIEPPVENNDGTDLTGTLYQCNICDKMIPFDYRKIHEDSHITGDEMNCNKCNKKFTSLEYLEMHMNVHNLDKVTVNNPDKSLPYECLYCNRRFARPHEKVKHERIHTGEKPHACEICGKSFRVSYCLTLHMRTHTGARPYACQHCGKRFKAHSVYNHHLLTHSEVRAYKCPYCPKAFKTSVQLAGHKNSHTKPFSCQQCNRPFASLYAVRIHTETHARQNNLKFSCNLCGASYARAFALKDHVKQVHKQDMDEEENTTENKEDIDWLTKGNNTVTEGMTSLNKDLHEDMPDLEMNTNELIVP